jgi:sugar/nucleoside kinase (ribokinase family)
MSILVLGTVAYDSIKTPAGERPRLLGGSAVHFSMSARLFTEVHVVANVGDDFAAKDERFLRSKGINVDSLKREKGATFHWSGEYVKDMNAAQTRATELGVLATFNPTLTPAQQRARFVFLANVDPEIQLALLKRISAPKLVGLDSMNFWIHSKREALRAVLERVDVYVANDQEARDLSEESNLLKAAEALRSMGPRIVVIKKGEHGCLVHTDSFVFALPAFPVSRVIDPTGAGDTFAGGCMGYLAKAGTASREQLKKAVAYGTVCASFNVEEFGVGRTCRLSMPQVHARMQRFRRAMSW